MKAFYMDPCIQLVAFIGWLIETWLWCCAGQVEDAERMLFAFRHVWSQFQGLPELFDMAAKERHPLQKVQQSSS